jgi:predicted flap endonuclease-1-like 5' DNA nuclease
MSYSIRDIDGINDEAERALKRAGIRTTAALLEAAKDSKGRKELSQRTGLDEQFLLRCANMADRLRIKGLGKDYAALIREAGVNTVRELKHRNAKRLFEAMRQANAARPIVKFLPSKKAVERWIEEAKALDIKISY